MDAKQIKPYTFWIVCGVIVVIELGLIAFWPIADENGHTPEEVKGQLDTDFKKLNDLYVRAGKTPTGVMDAERPEHIKALTEDYLITPKWKGVLQPHVDKYEQQLSAIRKDLATRSAVLHEPVADSGDLFSWYTAYVGKTKEVMLALRNAGALVVDEANRDDTDFENGSAVRGRVGFYTKVEKTPEANEHPLLTVRFRIMQKISEAIIASGSNPLPSPVVKTNRDGELEAKHTAVVKGAEWKRGGESSRSLSGPIAEVAEAHELMLTLEGSTSALIATQAAIEGISDPVMVVAGGTLSARGAQAAGARKGIADEPMQLRLTIAIIDFKHILNAPASDAIAGGTAK
jgi:hypothetical protein